MSSVGPALRVVWDAAVGLRHELAEMRLGGERGGRCATTSLAVALATAVALAVHVEETWWAAISGFMCSQATAPASLQKGVLRIVGTLGGAGLALLLSPWLKQDAIGLSLALFAVSVTGVVGLLVSEHGYSWLLGAITADMVLMALLSDPGSAIDVAESRTGEVIVGTVSAMLVAVLVGAGAAATPAAKTPGWSDLLGAQWPATRHAIRAGLAVMLIPVVWRLLDLPSLSQMAITVTAIMGVPSVSSDPKVDQQLLVERAMQRLFGCLFGGVAGLLCLAVSVESFLPWMLMLTVGIWVCAHVQASQRGIGYVGTQAAMVFISTLVQGNGPPLSILPGIERFAGIMGGLLILLVLLLLTAPSTGPPVVATRRLSAQGADDRVPAADGG
jgi:uncharacterized membrane protein YccC